MNRYFYKITDGDEVLASNMSLDVALILAEAILKKYNNIAITIDRDLDAERAYVSE